jgi:hypothetical protein
MLKLVQVYWTADNKEHTAYVEEANLQEWLEWAKTVFTNVRHV